MTLIAQYFFEGDLLDETTNNNDGTLNGGGTAVYVAGVAGQAFDFDGSTHIEIGDTPFDFERTDPFSISQWIKTTSVNIDDFIFGKNSGQQGYQMHLRTTNNEIRVKISNSNSDRIRIDTVGVNVRDGRWHHIVMTYSGSSTAAGVKIYVDGVNSATNIITDTLTATILHNSPFVIGNQEDTETKYFTGQMDYVGIYDTELTSEEVRDLFVNEGLFINGVRLVDVSALPTTVIEGLLLKSQGKIYIGDNGEYRRL